MKKKIFLILLIGIFLVPNIVLAVDENTVTSETNEEEDNSNKEYNNYLKKLEIEGYKIDFNKHQAIYEISISKNVNSLKINAEVESNLSKMEIKGADNLENNHDKVTIEVRSGKGEVKTYVINVKRIGEKKQESEGFVLNITDSQIDLAIIFGCIVLGVGLVIFVIIKIKDHKIEKQIDKW